MDHVSSYTLLGSLAEFGRSAGALVLGPFLYFLVGFPWAQLAKRVSWAPLLGVGVFGLAAELTYIAGGPVGKIAALVFVLHLAAGLGWMVRRPEKIQELLPGLRGFLEAYGMALIPIVAVPFALPGGWGGDWFVALESGRRILADLPFSSELLARPPLFGAAAAPLLLLGPKLAAFQAFCAIASACAIQVVRLALQLRREDRLIWVFSGSIFFLQITANAWPKFLAAAFIIAAWLALDLAGRRRYILSGVMLGLALATHQSSILFAPLLFARLWKGWPDWKLAFGRICAVSVIALIFVIPWESYTLVEYGLAAKIHANPAVAQRLAAVPAWLNIVLVGVSTFVAWGPIEIVIHYVRAGERLTLGRIESEVFWLGTSILNWSAGSMLGLVLPWWLALGGRQLWGRWRDRWSSLRVVTKLALGCALAGQMLLNPFYGSDGTLQTGWVPMGVVVVLCFLSELGAAAPGLRRSVLRHVYIFNTIPWIAFNLALTAILFASANARIAFTAGEGDWRLLQTAGLTPLGLGAFPWVQGAVAVLVLLQPRPAPGA